MSAFLIIGDGLPAKAAISAVTSVDPRPKLALLSPDPDRSGTAAFARQHGLEVRCAQFVRELSAVDWITAQQFDWLVSANNLMIVPARVLQLFPGRAVNCHPGILPEYAGVHVHQWAIRNGERTFGVTLHQMEPTIDAGAVLAERRFPIAPGDTGLSLFAKCMRESAQLAGAFIAAVLRGETCTGQPQSLERRRVYRAASAMDGQIDWSWPATRVIDFIRAGNYEPLASPTYTARIERSHGEPIEILRAVPAGTTSAPPGNLLEISPRGPAIACGDGRTICITRARRNGRIIEASEWPLLAAELWPQPGVSLVGDPPLP